MTTISPVSPYTTARVAASPLDTDEARRRRAAARVRAIGDAGAGAAALAPATEQQLPFRARASVRISNGLLYPVLGAVLGTLLLGLPGTIIGGVGGWLLAR